MSQQHHEQLIQAQLLRHDESIGEGIKYRLQVLLAFSPEHPLFERGCLDLLSMLIDNKLIQKAHGILRSEFEHRGDAQAAEAVTSKFASAVTTVLARAGLAIVSDCTPEIKLSSSYPLNPHAPPHSSPMVTSATNGMRVTSEALPSLSSTMSTPHGKEMSSRAVTPSPLAIIKSSQWGKKTIRVMGLPSGISKQRLDLDVGNFIGELLEFDSQAKEALARFPAVVARDMLNAESVVLGGQVCKVDDRVTPLQTNEMKEEHYHAVDDLDWGVPAKTNVEETPKSEVGFDVTISGVANTAGNDKDNETSTENDWAVPAKTAQTTISQKEGDSSTQKQTNMQQPDSSNAWGQQSSATDDWGTTAENPFIKQGNGLKTTNGKLSGIGKKVSSDALNNDTPNVQNVNDVNVESTEKKGDEVWGTATEITKTEEENETTFPTFEQNRTSKPTGFDDFGASSEPTVFDDGSSSVEKSYPVNPYVPAPEPKFTGSKVDSMSFAEWKKKATPTKIIGNKYRRDRPVETISNAGDEQPQAAETTDQTSGGWGSGETSEGWGMDGTVSPTYFAKKARKQPEFMQAGLKDDHVYALIETFPWNAKGVARALTNHFGENALALYEMPWVGHKYRRYIHEETITYYAKFRKTKPPAPGGDNTICIAAAGGDSGTGWFAKMQPTAKVEGGARQVLERGLVGSAHPDEFLI